LKTLWPTSAFIGIVALFIRWFKSSVVDDPGDWILSDRRFFGTRVFNIMGVLAQCMILRMGWVGRG
jgi:hypothetical protein